MRWHKAEVVGAEVEEVAQVEVLEAALPEVPEAALPEVPEPQEAPERARRVQRALVLGQEQPRPH